MSETTKDEAIAMLRDDVRTLERQPTLDAIALASVLLPAADARTPLMP